MKLAKKTILMLLLAGLLMVLFLTACKPDAPAVPVQTQAEESTTEPSQEFDRIIITEDVYISGAAG